MQPEILVVACLARTRRLTPQSRDIGHQKREAIAGRFGLAEPFKAEDVVYEPVSQQVIRTLLAEENRLGLNRAEYYLGFSARVEQLKRSLLPLLGDLKAQGKRIAAYGAAAKGATLINFVGIGPELVDFVVDRNIHKQGMFMPGQKIPIYPSERILKEKPDYVVLLPWNLESEILKQESAFREAGGQFIIPVPVPRIV